MQRVTMSYLAGYLLLGGAGLFMAPEMALKLLGSTGVYGTVMPRLVGMFMLVVAGFVVSFLRRGDYTYYGYTILARVFIVVTLSTLWLTEADPLFLVLDGIVLVGLVPSIYVHWSRSGQE